MVREIEYTFTHGDKEYSADIEYESPSVWSIGAIREMPFRVPDDSLTYRELVAYLESDPNLIAEAIECASSS